MERLHLFILGDKNEIAKIHSQNLKIFSSWTTGPILWYIFISSLIWTGFSGERCGPWSSCLFICQIYMIHFQWNILRSRFEQTGNIEWKTLVQKNTDLPTNWPAKEQVSTFYSGGHMSLVKYHGCYWEVEEVMVLGDTQ